MTTPITPGCRDADVVVVGAGPVGLFLAGQLRQRGLRTVVLERLSRPTGESRASQLNARTMEVLDARGLLGRLGKLQQVANGHFGGIPLAVNEVASHRPGYWKVPQARTEAALEAWDLQLGVDIRRSCELVGLEAGSDQVRAEVRGPAGTFELRAFFVVGCDGEHSTVRQLVGIDFVGHDARRELLRADLDGIQIADRSFQRHPGGLAIAARRPDGVTRVMVHRFAQATHERQGFATFGDVVQAWRGVTGEDLSAATPIWVDAFGDVSRQASSYRRARILLAGDACHAHLPAAGQAINLGLQDADNLAWKLAATVQGWAPPDLLDSYEAERHPVGARVLSTVEAQTSLLLGGPEVDPVRELLAEFFGLPGATGPLAAEVSGLDIRYDIGSDDPAVGRRLPHLELHSRRGPTTTTAELRHGDGLLLELRGAGRAGSLYSLASRWCGRVRHLVARPSAGRGPDDADVLLIRPDGHVAWTGRGGAADEAELHLTRWFGASDALAKRNSAITASPGGPVITTRRIAS